MERTFPVLYKSGVVEVLTYVCTLLVSNKQKSTKVRLSPLLLAAVLTSGCIDRANLSDLKPSVKKIVYPDSDDGFQSFFRDLVHVHASAIGVQSRMHDLLIPNDSAWFIEVFGPANGPVLDFQALSRNS